MNWNLFVTELVAGITHGSVYALIALGYSMVYGILKLLNFAHGDVYMVGAFIGYGIITVFGGAIERFAYRRLRNAPRIAPLITALGVAFFLENAAQLLFGAEYRSYDTFDWANTPIAVNGFELAAGVHVSIAQMIVIVGTVVLVVLLTVFVQRTQLGKAMRATSYDREAAAMMGIDVDRVIVATFFIGSALAGAAAVFNGLVYQQVWPLMGFQAGLFAFIAAVIGGIGSLPGSVLGGLVIGLAQSFSVGYISSTFSDAIVFAILIGVMLVRPTGLLGTAAVQKV